MAATQTIINKTSSHTHGGKQMKRGTSNFMAANMREHNISDLPRGGERYAGIYWRLDEG